MINNILKTHYLRVYEIHARFNQIVIIKTTLRANSWRTVHLPFYNQEHKHDFVTKVVLKVIRE